MPFQGSPLYVSAPAGDVIPLGCAGRDMTTGLLLDDLSPPDQAQADEGPMAQLRRRLTLLQGAQVGSGDPGCAVRLPWTLPAQAAVRLATGLQ